MRELRHDERPIGACQVRAKYSWSGENRQDLGFVEGDVIDVLNTGDGDWWTGKLVRTKQIGVFPRNFVVYVDHNQRTEPTSKAGRMRALNQAYSYVGDSIAKPAVSPTIADLQIPDPAQPRERRKSLQSSQDSRQSRTHVHGLSSSAPDALGIQRRPAGAASGSASSAGGSHSSALKTSQSSHTSHTSQRSTKSAEEILLDVSRELNGQFLDDVNLDLHAEDLRTPEFESGFDPSAWTQTADTSASADAPPVPPPHTCSLNSSRSSRHSRASQTSQTGLRASQELIDSMAALKDSMRSEPARTSKVSVEALRGPQIKSKARAERPAGRPADGLVDGPVPGHVDGPIAGPINEPALPQHETAFESRLDPKRDPNFDPKRGLRIDSRLGPSGDRDPTSYLPDLDIDLSPTHEFPEAKSEPARDPVPSPHRLSPQRLAGDKEKELGVDALQRASFESSPHSPALDADIPFNAKQLESHPGDAAERRKRSSKAALAEEEERRQQSTGQVPESRSFFKKLFPKNNTPHLRRAASRSSQRSAASAKSFKNKIKGVKSFLSFGSKKEDPPSFIVTAARPPSKSMDVPRSALPGPARDSAPPSAAVARRDDVLNGKWERTQRDLYRARTLTQLDIDKRKSELVLQGVPDENLVASLNAAAAAEYVDYRVADLSTVDRQVYEMWTWPQLMTPSVFASSQIGRHSANPVERVRAVFLVCATKIEHVAQTPMDNNVMQSRRATHREIAQTVYDMCSTLGIESRVVHGHIRVSSDHAQAVQTVEHSWNAVQVHGQWYFLDCVSAARESSDDLNLFYFLVPPFQLIYSHIPNSEDMQFLARPLKTARAALLPLAAPAAFAYATLFSNFWLGATRLVNMQACELNLRVPDPEIDIVALIGSQQAPHAQSPNAQALAQTYWANGERYARIKAFVPSADKHALLRLYAAPKQQAKRDASAMELLWTVEVRLMTGQKSNVPFEFVRRFAAPCAGENDLYVQEPQCRNLGSGLMYKFQVEHFGTLPGTKQPQIAVQSPSGRLTKLIPQGTDAHDVFKVEAKTMEVGNWRGIVMPHGQDTWTPFCEWFCS